MITDIHIYLVYREILMDLLFRKISEIIILRFLVVNLTLFQLYNFIHFGFTTDRCILSEYNDDESLITSVLVRTNIIQENRIRDKMRN